MVRPATVMSPRIGGHAMSRSQIAGRVLDRQIDEPEFFVDRHLRPDAGPWR
jgi:hypothetical protein